MAYLCLPTTQYIMEQEANIVHVVLTDEIYGGTTGLNPLFRAFYNVEHAQQYADSIIHKHNVHALLRSLHVNTTSGPLGSVAMVDMFPYGGKNVVIFGSMKEANKYPKSTGCLLSYFSTHR